MSSYFKNVILESLLSYARKQKSQLRFKTELAFAEKEGFEPPVPARVQRFSRPPHSTTLPFLRAAKVERFWISPVSGQFLALTTFHRTSQKKLNSGLM